MVSAPGFTDKSAGESPRIPQSASQQERFGNRGLLEHVSVNFKFACRQLYRNPSFAIIAVLTLSLGIGAVLAVFQTTDKALFQPLPYPGANRIVMLWGHDRSTPDQRALVSA